MSERAVVRGRVELADPACQSQVGQAVPDAIVFQPTLDSDRVMQMRFAVPSVLITLTLCLCLGCPFFTGASRVEHANVAFDISPDGERIVFSDADGDLWLFSLITKTVTRLTSTADQESTPSFSPDGRTIVYASAHENGKGMSIFSRSIDGTTVRRLTHDEQFSDYRPSFSPNGKTVAFARAHLHRPYSMGGWTWDKWDLYVVGADSTNLRRLTDSKHYDVDGVSFSADSQTIFYSADEKRDVYHSKQTLFEVSLEGTTNSLRPNKAGDYYAWISDPYSSAGTQIVFISDRLVPYHYDVLIMNRQTNEPRSLSATDVSPHNQNPAITKDGTTVLFLAGTEWNAGSRPIFSLWQVNSDGSDARQLADSSLFTRPAEWTPTQ